MKKKLLILCMGISCIAYGSANNLYIKAGADIYGNFDKLENSKYEFSKKKSDKIGCGMAIEYTRNLYGKFLELGFGTGINYEGKPKGQDMDLPSFYSIPLYITAKYNLNLFNNYNFYVKLDSGYSVLKSNGDIKFNDSKVSTSLKNGAYLGAGFGFEINNFLIETMYKVNKGKISFLNEKEKKFYYDRISLSAGYRFNF